VDKALHLQIVESCKTLFLTPKFQDMSLQEPNPNNNINFLNKLNKSYTLKKSSKNSLPARNSLPINENLSFTKLSNTKINLPTEPKISISPLKFTLIDENPSQKSRKDSLNAKKVDPNDISSQNQQKSDFTLKGIVFILL
jgi:hypothetical protein